MVAEGLDVAVKVGVDVTMAVAVRVGVDVTIAVAVRVGVEVLVAVAVADVGVAVEVTVGVPVAGFKAMSWARLEAESESSLPVPIAVSPVVALRNRDISAVFPFPEAVFLTS